MLARRTDLQSTPPPPLLPTTQLADNAASSDCFTYVKERRTGAVRREFLACAEMHDGVFAGAMVLDLPKVMQLGTWLFCEGAALCRDSVQTNLVVAMRSSHTFVADSVCTAAVSARDLALHLAEASVVTAVQASTWPLRRTLRLFFGPTLPKPAVVNG